MHIEQATDASVVLQLKSSLDSLFCPCMYACIDLKPVQLFFCFTKSEEMLNAFNIYIYIYVDYVFGSGQQAFIHALPTDAHLPLQRRARTLSHAFTHRSLAFYSHARTHARTHSRTHARSVARSLSRLLARAHAHTHMLAHTRTCAHTGGAAGRAILGAAANKAAANKVAQDKASQDKAAQDKASQDKAAQDKASQDKAAQEAPASARNEAAAAAGAFEAPPARRDRCFFCVLCALACVCSCGCVCACACVREGMCLPCAGHVLAVCLPCACSMCMCLPCVCSMCMC
jgi:hypothetical protein